jgi:hypothetical protein
VTEAVRKVIAHYSALHIATAIDWNLPVDTDSVWYRGQLLAINDCLYRFSILIFPFLITALIILDIIYILDNPQPLPLLEPLVEPVPSLEMRRFASGKASGVKFLLHYLLVF